MNKKRFIIITIVIASFFLFEDILLIYNSLNRDNPILGLRLANVPVGELTHAQITTLISQRLVKESPLQLQYNGNIITVAQNDVGAKVDYPGTLTRARSIGRNGNFLENIAAQNKALLGLSNASVLGNISKSLLLVKVLTIADRINQNPLPTMPDFSGNWKTVLPQKNGIKVDTGKLTRLIMGSIFNPPLAPIAIPVETVVKKYPAYDMDKIRKQAADYIDEPLSITSGGIVFILSPDDLKQLLTVSEQTDPTNPKKTIMVLTLDRTKLNQKLEPYAVNVESVTNAEFNDHDARAAIYSQFYTNTRRLVNVPTGSNLHPQVLAATTGGEKVAYITIDDGPNIIYHPMLLDILKEKNMKATFYLVGSNSKLYANTTKRTISEGHAIGNHSLTHAYLAKLLPNQIYDEIKTTKNILDGFLGGGKVITLFRPPYGGTNAFVEKTGRDLGLKQELWTVDPKDWSDPSTDELVNRVVKNVQNGSVILLHSNHFSTIKALPIIIDTLRAQGYQFRVQE